MRKQSLISTGMILLFVLSLMGCNPQKEISPTLAPQAEIPSSSIFEGRIKQWLTDEKVGIMATDFYVSFPAGDSSLGMTYWIANFDTSQLSFDSIRVMFQVTPIGDDNTFITTTDSMSVNTDKGLTTFFEDSFDENLDVSNIMMESFILQPSARIVLDVSGPGTPVQLVSGDNGPHRNYKITITLCTSGTVTHGPFTINVTALENSNRDIIFK